MVDPLVATKFAFELITLGTASIIEIVEGMEKQKLIFSILADYEPSKHLLHLTMVRGDGKVLELDFKFQEDENNGKDHQWKAFEASTVLPTIVSLYFKRKCTTLSLESNNRAEDKALSVLAILQAKNFQCKLENEKLESPKLLRKDLIVIKSAPNLCNVISEVDQSDLTETTKVLSAISTASTKAATLVELAAGLRSVMKAKL